MDSSTLFSKAVRYQRAASDNAFAFFSVVQNSGGEILKTSLEKMTWLPENGRQGCRSWIDICTRATAELKTMVDQGYEQAERLCTTGAKVGKAPKTTPAAPAAKAAAPAAKASPAAGKTSRKKKTAAPASRAPIKPAPPQKASTSASRAATKPAAVKKEAAEKTIPVSGTAAAKPKASVPAPLPAAETKTPASKPPVR